MRIPKPGSGHPAARPPLAREAEKPSSPEAKGADAQVSRAAAGASQAVVSNDGVDRGSAKDTDERQAFLQNHAGRPAFQNTRPNNLLNSLIQARFGAERTTGGLSDDQRSVLKDGLVKAGPQGFALTDAGARVRTDLVKRARNALAKDSFAARNEAHADAVGAESGLLAARATGADAAAVPDIQRAFTEAARDAGAAFAGAFSDAGNKIESREKSHYKPAMSAAGGIAFAALEALSGTDGKALVGKTNLADIADLVRNDLGVATELSPAEIKDLLVGMKDNVLKDDYYNSAVDDLPVGGRAGLSGEDQKNLNLGIRLANATWKAGQVHRAAWEGNDGRINPEVRTAYNPFDQLKAQMFDETVQAAEALGRTPAEANDMAFARVTFEVYKDFIQLAKAAKDS